MPAMAKLTVLSALFTAALGFTNVGRQSSDPCATVGGQKWVSPQDLRACFTSFAVDPTVKENIIEVINKTLAFHTSVNYEIRAPEPFTPFVHEDLLADLARIQAESYDSDFDLHIDLSRTLKRLNDGHCVWINSCYDSLFLNFLPIPLVLLTDSTGTQSVHIAPEAFAVASVEFSDEIHVWEEALPPAVLLQSLDGAKVISIQGEDPFAAVGANALITGSFQPLGTRQNSFFSSYQFGEDGWTYIMGDFAQQSLPLNDSVTLVVRRVNATTTDTITLPYRARISSTTVNFTDSASYRANNCLAIDGTNGFDLNETSSSFVAFVSKTVMKFQQQPPIPRPVSSKQRLNVMLNTIPLSDVALPPSLTPTAPAVPGGFGSGQFYMQPDNKTGVLALGSFGGDDFDVMLNGLVEGLVNLKSMGATQLIVDISNNGGGFICVAEFLHRIIVGPKNTTVPQAGLDTKARDGPLARLIVQRIIENKLDPDQLLLYNPLNWRNASNVPFTTNEDWLLPPVDLTINGHPDSFSQRLGQECQPFSPTPPTEALFPASKVVIVGNGRCASSCALFSITMAKEEGVKTVVIGGKSDIPQQYAGTVGGESSVFSDIDTEVKTAKLKNDSLAPPDLLVNGVQGITWRLGFGIDDPTQPEEWQPHLANLNLLLTPDLVNNPVAIWTNITQRLL